jgi:RNA polymerase sigma-70 factor (ECF subfamily)
MQTVPAASAPPDRELLEAARSGDEDAFGRLVEPYRPQLHAHCYRMLGSLHDADDALQDTLLRGWRGLSGFDHRRPLRPWLYKIATNACLDLIKRRSKRVLPVDHGPSARPDEGPGEPLIETAWLEPYPGDGLELADGAALPAARYEQREAVELAFVAALQHLPARQRAVLILRDVLDFPAHEVAESLKTTTASVNSALQRARKTVDERVPSRSQQPDRRSLDDEQMRGVLEAYVDAWQRRDVEAIVALLAEDATLAMPPFGTWWRGRDDIAGYLERVLPICPEARSVPTRANGRPAIAWYLWDERQTSFVATSIDLPTLHGARVKDIVAFVNPELFARFGLPDELPA